MMSSRMALQVAARGARRGLMMRELQQVGDERRGFRHGRRWRSRPAARACSFSMGGRAASGLSASRVMMAISAMLTSAAKPRPRKPRPSLMREQVADQLRDAETRAEQHEAAEPGPEQRAPAEAWCARAVAARR